MKFQVSGGSFRYSSGDRQVLDQISFSAESGDVLAILGPNGAGKTTLLRCSLGLLKWQAGKTELDGRDIRQMKARELWQKIAYVPQAAQASAPYTVEEMILLGRSSHFGTFSLPGKKDLEWMERVAERMGIEALRKKKFAELSGGERQMVLIARALAADPQVLVLDEPESNLDFRNQLLVLDTISELAASGLACIFNTHYPAHALRRANKALLLSRDGSCEAGPTARVVTEESLSKYFGVAAVIGDIETPGNIYRDVVPISAGAPQGGTEPLSGGKEGGRAVATLSVILPDRSKAETVNRLIHEVAPWIVGRMGMPHPEAGLYIINLVLDGPEEEIRGLTGRINLLPGVSVKATYAKRDLGKKEERART